MLSATLLGALVFLVLMAGLFVPLEYLAPGTSPRASARSTRTARSATSSRCHAVAA